MRSEFVIAALFVHFFPGEPDSYQLITFDPATEHGFYQLFITTAKKPTTKRHRVAR